MEVTIKVNSTSDLSQREETKKPQVWDGDRERQKGKKGTGKLAAGNPESKVYVMT